MPDTHASSDKLPTSHASRHAWALEKHGHLLAEALRKDTSSEARKVEKLPEEQIPARLVRVIMEESDPTQNKGMTAWLVGQYAQGKLLLEDLGTANETLTMFRRYAQRLEKSQRDLGQYLSLAAVWEAVIGFAQAEEQRLSGRAQKALDRDKAYTESRILRQDPDGFTIAVPLTEFAAKWWGRGTRWCTAAEKDNAFWQYHKEAPLIVVIIPELKEKGKFQLWVTKRSVQFMDAADKPVTETVIARHWGRFEIILLYALQHNYLALDYVPETLRTDEMCRVAVAKYGRALQYVSERLCTDEVCRIAVAQDGMALEYVPVKLRSAELCRIAAAQNGGALCHVPRKLRTEEICRIAVAQNGYALYHVPKKLRTDALCRIAVAQQGGALMYVPKDLRTEELCRIAVAEDGGALYYVPEALRTEALCKVAVTKNGWALKDVPQELRTAALCRIAVAQHGAALLHVPDALRSDYLYRLAVAQNGEALFYVPEALRTEEMCIMAVAQDGRALEHVPKHLQSAMQHFVKPPQPIWTLAQLDQWAEPIAFTLPMGASSHRL
jgi:hypothetical protein